MKSKIKEFFQVVNGSFNLKGAFYVFLPISTTACLISDFSFWGLWEGFLAPIIFWFWGYFIKDDLEKIVNIFNKNKDV